LPRVQSETSRPSSGSRSFERFSTMALHHIPEGQRAVTPYLIVEGAAKLIDFMKNVLDAEEIMRMEMPNGNIARAEMRIQDSIVMLADSTPEWTPRPANLYVYVPSVDETYKKALAAGCTSV